MAESKAYIDGFEVALDMNVKDLEVYGNHIWSLANHKRVG